ncbi:CSN-associated deubiquitinating enzyme Ubp12 [Apophysomyces ossiformis]|uniref:ubiquitinyl hydrolase 1 n=1 Tax=Apophysomyces ossiformis TaxID=679940 RepID=A0A8H7BQ23_9FUNG|nr:CSN-associated deubiquitinating enzyme Ubp12 [Apophysomyces ossiformis]
MSLETSPERNSLILVAETEKVITAEEERRTGNNQDTHSYQQALQRTSGDDVSPIMREDLEGETNASLGSASVPDLQPTDQLEHIEKLRQKALVDGETWYLVAGTWFKRWQTYCHRLRSSSDSTRKLGADTPPGPIDNRNILIQGELKEALTVDEDMYMLPEEAWNCLCEWYDLSSISLPRQVITEGEENRRSSVVEIYPPAFRLHLVASATTKTVITVERPPEITLSRKSLLADLKHTVFNALDLGLGSEIRMWRLDKKAVANLSPTIPAIALRDGVLLDDLDDSKSLSEISLASAVLAIEVRDKITGKYPADGIDQFTIASYPHNASKNSFDPLVTSNAANQARTDQTVRPAALKRSPSRTKGVCGLNNLGNTCYMNSALQCLINTPQLTQWFLAGNHQQDLNKDNPLGMGGEVAKAYGALIEKLWGASSNTIAPREFKFTIGRFNTAFMGYQQHDSQELLSFLLDGLHEDLNRILKKPYIELPDFEDVQDEEIAEKSWAYHKARNDSIIVDLFQGQFKSRVVCNECGKVSVTFDPFMYLSLPLPIQKKTNINLVFVPYDPSKRLQLLTVTVNKDANIKQLRNEVTRLMDLTNPSTLLIVELFSHKIYKIFDLNEPIASIGGSDIVVVYELPGSLPEIPQERPNKFSFGLRTSSAKASDPPSALDDPNQLIVFPVYCATSTETGGVTDPQSIKQFGEPIVLGIRCKDACKLDNVYSLIVQHVERYAVMKLFEEVEHPSEPENDMMEIDSESVRMSMEIDGVLQQKPIHTAAAVTAAGGKRMQPMKNLFKMKVFSENRSFGKSSSKRLFPLNFSSWNHITLTDLKQRAEEEAKEREAIETAQMNSTETDTNDVSMKEINSSERSSEAGEDADDVVEDAATAYTKSTGDKLRNGFQRLMASSVADKRKRTSTPASRTVIRQGEGILIEWKMKKAQDMFGSMKGRDNLVNEEAWCDTEKYEKVKTDPSISNDKKQATLADCLDEFTKEEQLGEDDLWYCPKCKAHQRATKKFDLWRLPEILVVHLKRFSHSRTWRDKIDAFIDFPLEGLDLTDRVLGKSQGEEGTQCLIYDLYAVDNHFGGLGGGHYTAYALNNEDNTWYNFDDSHVSKTDANQVKTNAAYLLFFKRRSPVMKSVSDHDTTGHENDDAPSSSSSSSPIEKQTNTLPASS